MRKKHRSDGFVGSTPFIAGVLNSIRRLLVPRTLPYRHHRPIRSIYFDPPIRNYGNGKPARATKKRQRKPPWIFPQDQTFMTFVAELERTPSPWQIVDFMCMRPTVVLLLAN